MQPQVAQDLRAGIVHEFAAVRHHAGRSGFVLLHPESRTGFVQIDQHARALGRAPRERPANELITLAARRPENVRDCYRSVTAPISSWTWLPAYSHSRW